MISNKNKVVVGDGDPIRKAYITACRNLPEPIKRYFLSQVMLANVGDGAYWQGWNEGRRSFMVEILQMSGEIDAILGGKVFKANESPINKKRSVIDWLKSIKTNRS